MAILSAGAKLQVDIASVYTDVIQIMSIGGPQITVADVDVTHLQSSNVFKEFIAGFGDGGVVQLEAIYDKAQLATLYGFIRTTKVWRILFSDSSKWDFSGHINALSTDQPLEEEVGSPFAIKVTGKPTFTQ